MFWEKVGILRDIRYKTFEFGWIGRVCVCVWRWAGGGGGGLKQFFFRRITSPSASAEGCSVLGVNLELVNESHVYT